MVEEETLETRAEWDTAYINDLPDSAFAAILPGGEKDDEGKTVPRDLRKLPHHDAAGEIDMPHLRNALSRESQADIPEATHTRAQSHLQAHMESQTRSLDVAEIQVRDAAKRELDIRLVPWNVSVETLDGSEEFRRGAFADSNPDRVLLMGLEHEAHIGIGQNGQPVMTRRPTGKATRIEEREDGAYGTFRVAKTAAGDEQLALAADGIVNGASIEFVEVPGGTDYSKHNGRRRKVHNRVDLRGVSTTYRPAYGEHSAVLAVRSQADKEVPSVGETATALEGQEESKAPVIQPTVDYDAIAEKFGSKIGEVVQARSDEQVNVMEKLLERVERVEEQARMAYQIPSKQPEGPPDDFHMGDWMKLVLRSLSGEMLPNKELEARVAADLITADNLGVVPEMFTGDIRETIEVSRPFLESTRQLSIPRSGMQLNVPVLTTRPTVGVQAAEKDELTSTTTAIDQANFNPTTIGGYGDISLQLLKRSDPSYLELYIELLGEAYGTMADDKAVDALLAASGINNGGALDPNDLSLGTAWENGVAVSRRLTPTHIWLSSMAVREFIDAKATTTNTPLYSNLEANFRAGSGPGGTIQGLRPVHVPALDDEAVDAIVGPSRGFGWAEDGTYTLQVDVPAKAGRDVGLIGMVWYAPLYGAAFTTYTVAS